MSSSYTLQDIRNLLLNRFAKGFEWNYVIYDRITGEKRLASIEDFADNLYGTVSLVFDFKGDEYSFRINVSDFSFMIYEDESNIMGSGSTTRLRDNLTNDWINLLLNEHKEEYARKLLKYSEKNIARINADAEQNTANNTTQFQERVKKELRYYEKLINKVNKSIPLYDLVEIKKEM